MTDKRFKHKRNRLGMQFICYDDKEELLGTFADVQGVTNIVELLNELHEENKALKSDLTHTKVLYHSLQDTYSGLLKLVHGFNGDVE